MKVSIARPFSSNSPRKTEGRSDKSPSKNLPGNQLSYYPSPHDLTLLGRIKDNFNLILEKSNRLISENQSIQGIYQSYKKNVEQTNNSFMAFYNAANAYFQKHQTLRLTAVSNEVVSSSSCRIPVQNFSKDWADLSKQIDTLTDSHPPPHISEIELRFNSISSALDIITHSNKKRRFPSLSLNNCVENILFLNSKISKNIRNLFMQPSFPYFESNLLKSFTDEVDSYKAVLADAFQNEFVQSGILLPDLNRIKQNMFTDCNEVISCLKSSFVFPDEMKVIQQIKNEEQKDLDDIFKKLAIPFAIIIPINAEQSPKSPLSPKLSRENSESSVNDIHPNSMKSIFKSISQSETIDDYKAMLNDLLTQLAFIYELDLPKNPKKAVNAIIQKTHEIKTIFKTQEKNYKTVTQSLNYEIQQREDYLNMMKEKMKIIEELKKTQDKQLDESRSAQANLENRRNMDERKLTELQNEIERLTMLGDPVFFRNELRKSVHTFSVDYQKKLKDMGIDDAYEPLDEEAINKFSDEELFVHLNKLISASTNSKCRLCEKKECIIKEAKRIISEISHSECSDIIESLNNLMKSFNEFNEKYQNEKQEQEELKQKIIDEAVNNCQTNRITESKIKQMTVKQVLELISQRFVILKRNSISAEEMEQKMFLESAERLSHLIGSLEEVSKKKEEMPQILHQTEDEQKETIDKLMSVMTKQKENIQALIDSHIKEEQQLKLNYDNVNKVLGSFGFRMADALGLDTENKNNDELLDISFQEIKRIREPLLKQIEEMKETVNKNNKDLDTVYSRLLSLYNTERKEDMFKDIHSIISRMHEEKSSFNQTKTDNEKIINTLMTYLAELETRLKQNVDYQNEEVTEIMTVDDISEENKSNDLFITGLDNNKMKDLFERIDSLVDGLVSPNYSASFVQETDLDTLLKPVAPFFAEYNAKTPIQIVSLLSKKFLADQQTIQALSPSSNLISSIMKRFDISYQIDISKDFIDGIRIQSNRLKKQFERIGLNSSLQELIAILVHLVTLFDMSLGQLERLL